MEGWEKTYVLALKLRVQAMPRVVHGHKRLKTARHIGERADKAAKTTEAEIWNEKIS